MVAWQHDSAACLVKDGILIAAAEEERFNRLRHSRGFPKHAIDFCLKKGGISIEEVDIIAISYNPYAFLQKLRINFYWQSLLQDFANLAIFLWNKKQLQKQTKAKIVYIDHHLAHAASE